VSSSSLDCPCPISPLPACPRFPSQQRVPSSTSPFTKDGTAAETLPSTEKRLLQPAHTSQVDILIFSSHLSGPVILKFALGIEFSILTFKKASKQTKRQGFLFRFYCCFQSSSLMLFLDSCVLMLWHELLGFPFASIK